MELLTKAIKEQLSKYPLYSQDGKGKDAICLAKFFICAGAWTWYVLESDKEFNEMFGVIINGYGEGEYGYFTMQELESLKLGFPPFGDLKVERDIAFKPMKLSEISDPYLKKFLTRN